MRAFRILLALAVAGATFYSLNVLAIKHGYPDRLDYRNRNHCANDCRDGHFRNHHFSEQRQPISENLNSPIDHIKK